MLPLLVLEHIHDPSVCCLLSAQDVVHHYVYPLTGQLIHQEFLINNRDASVTGCTTCETAEYESQACSTQQNRVCALCATTYTENCLSCTSTRCTNTASGYYVKADGTVEGMRSRLSIYRVPNLLDNENGLCAKNIYHGNGFSHNLTPEKR